MWVVGVFVVALLVIYCSHWMSKWKNPKFDGVLPPGSMGLPFIGESIQFFMPSYSIDLHPFFKTRFARFGPIFRTNLAGVPVVVASDPEVVNYILNQDGETVEANSIDAFGKAFRFENKIQTHLAAQMGKYVRSNIPTFQNGYKKMKERWVPEMETLFDETLSNWSSQSSIEVKHAITAIVSDFIAKQLFGNHVNNSSSKLIGEKLISISDGIPSFPLNVPGTNYHKFLKNIEETLDILKDMIKERKNTPANMKPGDFLDEAITQLNTETFFTEDFFIVALFSILFAGTETIFATVALALNFIEEDPSVLQELIVEHEAIIQRRANPNSPLTWEEYKSMTFTNQVINETLRLASNAPGVLRRALKDIHMKGYTIPAGWTLLLATGQMHLDPKIYKDPLAFNPWRWKELEPKVVSKHFKPFGGRLKFCPGADFAKTFSAIFFHVLVTKFRWKKSKVAKVVRHPNIGFVDGVHIQFMDKHSKKL